MTLALFDLDNTLLDGDSDYAWGQHLIELGVVDREHYEASNRRFYEQYQAGLLDIHAFARFAYQPLIDNPREDLMRWREDFMQRRVMPMMLETGRQRIDWHRRRGDAVMIITATNSFVTRPIADAFGVSELIATEPEQIDGRYTGRIAGTPCFQSGKVTRLEAWLAQNGGTLEESWFYSDSHNDVPLLERVSYPVAIDPDPQLRAIAVARGWPIASFRESR
ncbi:MAG: HAD family hydrolase [Thiotrichales bacterium]